MRKLFTILIALVATTALWAQEYDFQSGDLYYNITSDFAPYTVEVTYEKWLSSDNYAGLTTATIPETVTYNGTTYSVTSIDSWAFNACSSLSSITIPNSVTSIGGSAFSGCRSLESITIPNSVTSIGGSAFSGCRSLESITIPNSVTSIGGRAFSNCSSLTSITIPNSVTSIGDGAFEDCESLTTPVYNAHCFAYMPPSYSGAYTIPNGIKQIAGGAFEGCSSLASVSIPNSVTSIGDGAFWGCSSLTSVSIPEGVTSIGNDAFWGCSSLTSITIPNSVTSIGEEAFEDCSSLRSLTIPNSVTSIGEGAFYGCSSLASITIPNSVKSIGYMAFYYCSSLSSITIPNSVTSIGRYAFRGCSSLFSITIPNSVTSIGNGAFYGCTSITTPVYNAHCFAYMPPSYSGAYTIPNGIKQIAGGAFDGCSALTSITIPNSVTSIGGWAFEDCESLTTPVYNAHCFAYMPPSYSGAYTIPNGIKQIAGGAFEGCSSLSSITIPNSVTSIGSWAFEDCESLTTPVYNAHCFAYMPPSYSGAYTIPNGIKQIAGGAFEGCSSLSSITIPNSVTSIGDGAFWGYSSLSSITIPNSVTSIGDGAFWGCSSLTSVSIPEGVTSIGNDAFWGCSSLTSITIPNSVTSIGSSAFEYCEFLKEIKYTGTQAQWGNIDKDSDWESGCYANISYNAAPPLLALVENSLSFSDATNNKRIDGNEQSQIRFRVHNFGKGAAIDCEARISMTGSSSGISVQTVKLPTIDPGAEQEISIPVKSDINTQDGEVTFAIEVYEQRGFGVAPFNLTVATKAFEAPLMQVTDHHITSASGKVQRMVPFTLTYNLQNTQYGVAEDVKVEVKYPSNVIVVEGQEQATFSQIKSGETKTLQLSLLANNHAASTLPITIHIKEKYGKYAENKQISVAMNQSASTNVTIVSTATEQSREEIQIGSLLSAVDRNIPKTDRTNPNTFVVILANENYQNVAAVPYALNDGKVFRQYCEHTLGIPAKNIKLYTDATFNEMRLAITQLKQICEVYEGEAEVILYYAGHGIPDAQDKASYLLPTDGDGRYVTTAYKLDELYQTLGAMPAKSVTVLMDACFSGANRNDQMLASERGVKLVSRPGMPKGKMVILSAAQGDQTALPNEKEKHGMFTYFLLKKLQETEGNVTLGELSEYIIREVKRESVVVNKLQTPTVSAAPAVQGEWQGWRL